MCVAIVIGAERVWGRGRSECEGVERPNARGV